MPDLTNVDTEAIGNAEKAIDRALFQVRFAVKNLNTYSADFQAAAGDDHKNGNLKTQSQAEERAKKDQADQANQAGEKDRDAARDARHQYGGTDDEGSVAINSLNLVEMKFA